jgi:tetratricopeptide (TPR) repeat protein
MRRSKTKPSAARIDQLLGEASWLLSHAQALADYGRKEEAAAEWARAAECEEQVAYLLEADGQDREAAVHRVSAASCYEEVGQYARAATLLRAALSVSFPADYLARVEQQRTRCLLRARKELRRKIPRKPRKPSPAVN